MSEREKETRSMRNSVNRRRKKEKLKLTESKKDMVIQKIDVGVGGGA